ncbi:MAG: hypothetical protein JO244_03740 [Solirubrobacterales bacterium]|nr:hypothetical protein [Solirubrobacterales bacterium]
MNGTLHAVSLADAALSSRWLTDQLASLPGYDPSHCGERVAARRTIRVR